MEKIVNRLLLFFVLLLVVSCRNKAGKNTVGSSDMGQDSISSDSVLPVFNFEGTPDFDTLSYDNIIKEVRFFPLETSENSFIGDNVSVRYVDNIFLVSSFYGFMYNTYNIKMFDSEGKFLGNVFNYGRGPNEITLMIDWICNNSTKEVTIKGEDKYLIYDLETHEMSSFKYESQEKIFFGRTCALNNGTYVTLNGRERKASDEGPFPYMFQLDSCMKIIKQYADQTVRSNEDVKMPEGRRNGPYLGISITQSEQGVLFRDMTNDTIFLINEKGDISPSFIMNLPEKLKPTMSEEVNDYEKKKQKIYYHIKSPVESRSYIFASYEYKGAYYSAIWSKNSLRRICVSESERLGYWLSFNGLKEFVTFEYCGNNKLYIPIAAKKLVGIIPNINPDDNPVIAEITLKDDYR